MSKKQKRNFTCANKTTYQARFDAIKVKIWIDIFDFQVGLKAGQAGQEKVPDCLVGDFCAWYYGYGIGIEHFERTKNSK
ncbi:hypothetical protein AAKU61_004090 [Undibacterium sp. GrIS 1.2]|uniref:hypothetical protein n=1 Tax=Undibacterium sp. GrIS 1.2 TaxID=3143933 RepID=UPI0033985A24